MVLWNALPAVLALLLAGCATAYNGPTDHDPHATIKYRRAYDQPDGQKVGPSLREILTINDLVAYEATRYAVLAQTPRVDEVRVRPEPATFTLSVTFFHVIEVPTVRSDQGGTRVLDGGCSSAVHVSPAKDATYVLELSFRENYACSLSCFEQVPRPNGELENRACPAAAPAPAPPQTPQARPVTGLELH